MRDALPSVIRDLLPAGVALALWEGHDVPEPYPEEEAAVARAVPTRVADFRRGRACARAALAQLGAAAAPILVGPERAPIWPPGFVGSITHCRGLVAAVAARTDRLIALGLDAEPAGPLPTGTDRHILHPLDARGDGSIDLVFFSAKESIFKVLHPLTGVWLNFLDVVLDVDRTAGGFRAVPAPDASTSVAELAQVRGRYAVTADLVITAAWIESTGRG